MSPSQRKTKDIQDEARRLQQADERVQELEQALRYILRRCDEAVYVCDGKPGYFQPIRAEAQDALNGGGGDA